MSALVAVITTGQRELSPSLATHLAEDTELHVHYDWDMAGVAASHNANISRFMASSHDALFLLNDDVDLRIKGWESMFTDNFDWPFTGYPNPCKAGPASSLGPISFWHILTGVFYYMTREHVTTVGGFNTKLGRYGWTDVGYMHRSSKAYGWTTFPFPIRALPAISPRDLYGPSAPLSAGVISVDEKHQWIERNRPLHLEEINGPVYLPYDQ